MFVNAQHLLDKEGANQYKGKAYYGYHPKFQNICNETKTTCEMDTHGDEQNWQYENWNKLQS